MKSAPSRSFAACVLGLTLLAPPARAEDAADAEAERLFKEGNQLLEQAKGDSAKIDAACAKLAASRDRVPRVGTLLKLALCYEQRSAWGSAVVTYRAAEAGARQLKVASNIDEATRKVAGDAETYAHQRSALLEPKVTWVDLRGSAGTMAVDGKPAGKDELLALDPGTHVVSVSETPSAAPVASAPVAPVAASPPPSPGSTGRTLAFIAGGVGLVGVAVGASFGIATVGRVSVANSHCPGPGGTACADGIGLQAEHDGRVFSHVSEAGFALGLLGLAGAGILFFGASRADARAGTASPAAWRVSPALAGGYDGLAAAASF